MTTPVGRLRAEKTAASTQAELAEVHTTAETSGRGHPAIVSKFERITCCKPDRSVTAGGWNWYHARSCPLTPNRTLRETNPELFKNPFPRTARLLPLQPHAACKAAFADGGTPCSRCRPLLDPDDYDLEHSDAAPDWGRGHV